MTEQLAITLAAASVGFASAIFFCIGNVSNASEKILSQSTPFWDFSEPVASSLAAQRAQYVVGALLLAAFALQIAAALASSTNLVALPPWLHTWLAIVLVVLVPTLLVAALFARLLFERTIRKVCQLEAVRREEDEQLAKNQGRS